MHSNYNALIYRYTKSRILYESGLSKVPIEITQNIQRSKEYEIQVCI